MNRILALQGMSGTSFGADAFGGDSNQSHHCSSSTAECSTQSMGCQSPMAANPVAW